MLTPSAGKERKKRPPHEKIDHPTPGFPEIDHHGFAAAQEVTIQRFDLEVWNKRMKNSCPFRAGFEDMYAWLQREERGKNPAVPEIWDPEVQLDGLCSLGNFRVKRRPRLSFPREEGWPPESHLCWFRGENKYGRQGFVC